MNQNPYDSSREVVLAEFAEPTAKSEIARLERSIAWLWGNVVLLWVVVVMAIVVAVDAVGRLNSRASSESGQERLEVGSQPAVVGHQ